MLIYDNFVLEVLQYFLAYFNAHTTTLTDSPQDSLMMRSIRSPSSRDLMCSSPPASNRCTAAPASSTVSPHSPVSSSDLTGLGEYNYWACVSYSPVIKYHSLLYSHNWSTCKVVTGPSRVRVSFSLCIVIQTSVTSCFHSLQYSLQASYRVYSYTTPLESDLLKVTW